MGDEIVSYDPNNNEYYMSEVVDTVVHDREERFTHLADLILDDNTKLSMTLSHPVYTKDGYKALQGEKYPMLTEDDVIISTISPF